VLILHIVAAGHDLAACKDRHVAVSLLFLLLAAAVVVVPVVAIGQLMLTSVQPSNRVTCGAVGFPNNRRNHKKRASRQGYKSQESSTDSVLNCKRYIHKHTHADI